MFHYYSPIDFKPSGLLQKMALLLSTFVTAPAEHGEAPRLSRYKKAPSSQKRCRFDINRFTFSSNALIPTRKIAKLSQKGIAPS